MSSEATIRSGAFRGYPPRAYAFFVVGVLMAVTFQAQLDRQLPALLVSELRKTFDVTDTQISFFQGAAFVVLYVVMAPVFGRLVDRDSRRNLILFGVLFWSGMTIWSAFAASYWQLLISRMGVGFAEAVLAPAAYSLIADYVEPQIRGRTLAIYLMSMSLGTGSSLIVGGAVMGALADVPVAIPGYGDMDPWRVAFLVVGVPGVIGALLMLLVREPERRDDGSVLRLDKERGTFAEFAAYARRHRRAIGLLIAAQVSASYIGNAMFPWLPTFYQRVHDVPIYTTGPILGAILIGTGIAGLSLSGMVSDYWTQKGDPAARLRPLLISQIITLPALVVWPLVDNIVISFALLGVVLMQYAVALGTLPTSLQELVPNRMRGKIVTTGILLSTLVGYGIGPTITALFTDYVFKADDAIGYSLSAATAPAALISICCAWLGLRPYGKVRQELHGS